MIIEGDLRSPTATVGLTQPDACARFNVAALGGDVQALAAALQTTGIGHLLLSGDAMIQTVVVVQLVEGRVDADGPNRFASMVPYAKDTGRVDETTSSLQAHVEWT